MKNLEFIRQLADCELAEFLAQWATSPRAWQKDPGETLQWLHKTDVEDEDETDGI